jgi:serine/threonine protein kinase
LGEQLGVGAYSYVYKGLITKNGNFIAVKNIKIRDKKDKKFVE